MDNLMNTHPGGGRFFWGVSLPKVLCAICLPLVVEFEAVELLPAVQRGLTGLVP